MTVTPSMSRSWWAPVAAVATAWAALAGCQPARPATAPVRGALTLDGQPLAGATITFVPVDGGRPARGETDVRGDFHLATFDSRMADGALLGEHRVTVTKNATSGPPLPVGADGLPLSGARPKLIWLAPQRYSSAATSGLSAQVRAGDNEFLFSLSSQSHSQ